MISRRLSFALSITTWILAVYVVWYLAYFSISYNDNYGIGIFPSIAFVAFTVLLFWKHLYWVDNLSLCAWVVSAILAIFMLTGFVFSNGRSFTGVFSNVLETVSLLVFFIGLMLIINCVIVVLWNYLSSNRIAEFMGVWRNSFIYDFVKKRPMLFCVIALTAFYLPYMIIFFPASVPYDTMYQLLQYTGFRDVTNHHPWLVTYFYGALFSIGHSLGNDNIGVFTITCVCTLVQISCYSFAIASIMRLTDSVLAYIGSLVFFALIPCFPAYSACIVKDGLFMAFFAVFMTSILELLFSKQVVFSQKLVLIISALLLCVTRHNGIYVVLPTLVVLFFVVKGDKTLIIGTVFLFAFGILVNIVLPGFIGIASGSSREMLSIPFQQTARYVNYYSDEVTTRERKAIDSVLNYSALQEDYNPEVADYVKNTFKEDSSESDRKNYFHTWVAMGIKHPLVYLDATADNSFGYIYPFCNSNAMSTFNAYIHEGLEEGKLDIHYVFGQESRNVMIAYMDAWRDIPGFSLLLSPGFYTWLVVFLIGYSINRKAGRECIALYIPVICMLIICIMSPVNGWLRYSLPIVAVAPILCTSALILGKGALQDTTIERPYRK